MNDSFHIAIDYQKGVPDVILSDFEKSISSEGLLFKSKCREPEIFMSMEWAVPSIIVAYLSKPYFESFLKEAGKDHYQLVKKGFICLFGHIFGEKPETREVCRSQLFSIVTKLHDDRTAKFVFPEGVNTREYEKSLDSLYELVSSHYNSYPNDELSHLIEALSTPSNIVYIEYCPEEKNWILLDPFVEAHKLRKEQERKKLK